MRSSITLTGPGLLAAGFMLVPWDGASAGTLPVPCVPACANGTPFVTSGQASASAIGSKLTISQSSANASLNWQSFNISNGATVQFVQPASSSIALNRIFDANPSQIFGVLTANGRIYLINQNGIIFGSTAQVNVGSLIASSLGTSIDTLQNGYSVLSPYGAGKLPAFQQAVDANGNPIPAGAVTVSQGATITTPEGGQVLLFAPQVVNDGTITTPGGQTMLAAGTGVYLLPSSDPNLRGLAVYVAADSSQNSSVTNGDQSANAAATSASQVIGQIAAERGDITLAALAVNQYGRLSANTSINENGSIRLQASTTSSTTVGVNAGGTLTLGPGSVTEVTLDTADPSTTVDSIAQPKSSISMSGKTIDILGGATVRATGGTIQASAQANSGTTLAPPQEDGSRVYVAPGTVLDVSGATVTLPVSSNVIPVQLRATELADSPLQRNGPLHGETVYVDARAHGTNPDGTTWEGTPLANVSGELADIERNVAERNLTGGSISLSSSGDVIVAPGAGLNVSGGAIDYTGGIVKTTTLLTVTGQAVPIAQANPNVLYAGTLDSLTVSNPKWGTSATYGGITGTYEPGYVEGKDAGALSISAPRFVLDGTINAAVQAGPYQRLPAQAPISGGSYFEGYDQQPDLYRNFDQVPFGARLFIGQSGPASSNFGVDNVVVQSGVVSPGLRKPDGNVFDPLSGDPLPATYTASVLRPELVGGNEFNHVSVATNGTFVEPEAVSLRLAAGGTVNVLASAIDIEGVIDAPGGSIMAESLASEAPAPSGVTFTLGPHASLTARGEWVNDNPALYDGGANTAPLYTAGGSVSLSILQPSGSPASLTLDPGSLIDVSGGAQLTSSGRLVPGKGGTVTLATPPLGPSFGFIPPTEPVHIDLGATLKAYGLTEGGTLNVGAGAVCIAASDCTMADPNTLWLPPGVFANGGFGSYAITAEQGALTVLPDTSITLQQRNLGLVPGFASLPDSATLPALPAPVLLPELLRQPTNLSLTQQVLANELVQNNVVPALAVFPTSPSLSVGAGASIAADPGATLSLSSSTRILVDGELSAPGGTVSLTLQKPAEQVGYAPTQGIWLGPTAMLDVHGVPQIQVGDTGLRSGTVLRGGTVSFDAELGYVELEPGSFIDLSGNSATIDVVPAGRPVRSELVASAGGTLNVSASDGIVLDAGVRAAAGAAGPQAAQPQGGTLSLSLNGSSLNSDDPNFSNQIVVTQGSAPIVIQPGSAVPNALAGKAFVSADTLAASGFDSVALAVSPTAAGTGQIEFNGNVNVSTGRLLELDAGSFAVTPGGVVSLESPYVGFGNSTYVDPSQTSQTYFIPPPPTSGTGVLNVAGGFVELYGSTSLEGIGSASFSSTGDLRLRGLLDPHVLAAAPAGQLAAAGNLSLSASQIYPTTLAQFAIKTNQSTGTINVQGTPGANEDLLSAGGSLTLLAGTVQQDGVLRAPFGTIDIDARSIELAPGSLTSTSANGLTIPFGTTQGGFDWTYQLLINTLVYGSGHVAPPSQGVVLRGTTVALDPKSVVDVSGGGDLQAYEWIPGVGGTRDVLSPQTRPSQFAILPGLHANVAPYDFENSTGTSLEPGDAIYLAGAPGLPAGNYQLLPARYALLPGAFLVTPASGYPDIQAGQSFSTPDGGTVVAGFRTVAGTGFGDSRTSGFEVIPASVVVQGPSAQAQYTTTGANQFFAAQAQSANVAPPALPRDSGVLQLIASGSLSLDGSLRTQAGAGGLGGSVDISSANIGVVGATAPPANPGELLVSAASLDQLGAQSILLGGERTSSGALSTDAQAVTVDAGAALTAPEVLLTANQAITVQDGASVTASGTAAQMRAYSLSGDGAFLSVSAGPQATVTRTTSGAPTSGVLTLQSGSSLSASQGSIFLDATESVITQGNITAPGGDLAVQSTQIALGAGGNPSPTTTVLLPSFFAGGLHNVLLQSSSPIDFNGSVALQAQNLTFDAPALAGSGGSGDNATVSVAGALALANSSANTLTAQTGSGSLVLSAADVLLGPGAMALSGFRSVALNAQNAVTATGDGGLSTAGDLAVTASRITAAAGVNTDLAASGSIMLLSPSHVAQLAPVTDLGGALAVTGTRIELGTQLLLPSGSVSLTATASAATSGTGDIVLDGSGRIDVSGVVRTYDGVNVPTPGGSVTLNAAGNVTLSSNSAINVSAAAAGEGGSLSMTAAGGQLTAAGTLAGAGVGGQGSSVSVDAQGFDFSALNSVLNSGGFSAGRSFRLSGSSSPGAGNDLIVGPADAVTAHNVSLAADHGSVQVQGLIDASGASGGSIVLAGANGVSVSGTLDAHATAPGSGGGSVELYSSGSLLLSSGSLINVSGGAPAASGEAGSGGTVLLRVPQAALTSGSGTVALGGNIQGATHTTLEASQIFDSPTGTLTATDLATDPANPQSIYNQTAAFMANAAALTAGLNPAPSWNLLLEPGVEIRSTSPTGSLELDAPWNLFGWRFGPYSAPGVLTLRALGGLTINSTLSDGFASVPGVADAVNQPFTLPASPSSSWSYRLVAGADLTAANPLSVVAPPGGAPGASVTIASCPSDCALPPRSGSSRGGVPPPYTPVMVRTGNGFIDVSASGDFVLGSPASMLYTAGVLGPAPAVPVTQSAARVVVNLSQYPTDGGDITIAVDGNVTGPTNNTQFVNDWLWRLPPSTGSAAAPRPSAWTVDFESFQQGVAALGGGNVLVSAGGDITDLSVSIPSTGRPTNATTLQVAGGGNLTVEAGASILGGNYYAGLGSVALQAGREVGADAAGLDPLVGLGNASLAATARDNLSLAGVVNPTLLNGGVAEPIVQSLYFSTYGPASNASLTSVGGDVTLNDESASLNLALGTSFAPSGLSANDAQYLPQTVLSVFPSTLTVQALSGNINVGRQIVLSPASNGNLQLFADRNLSLTGTATLAELVLPDVDPSTSPSPAAPVTADLLPYGLMVKPTNATNPDQLLTEGVYAATPVHENDPNPVQLVARTGDVDFALQPSGAAATLWSAKPVHVVAGRDVLDLNLIGQNLHSADVTSISAGRDIIYPESRDAAGNIIANTDQVTVGGPGEVELSAGRNVNLGTSNGITTRGNLDNINLLDGASVSIEAGVGGNPPQLAAFISQYIDGSSDFDAQLTTFMETTTGVANVSAAQAKQTFGTMSPELQRVFVEQVFFDLLRTYGRQAAAAGNGDFAGAFAALQSLFPGSNPDLASGQTNPYAGNIELFFSHVYTDAGGNTSLLSPGGSINVGLAQLPTAYHLNKAADQLGLVAQTTGDVNSFSYSDFQVNESRVFAADGGNVLVWSTEGNIDAGRGSKTALSAPPATFALDPLTGATLVTLRPPLTGSGIQTLASEGTKPGDVDLFAPHGVVNANEAGIVAGNLTIAATAVIGTNNITVSGTSVGVPVAVTGLGANVAGASSAAGGALGSASSLAESNREEQSRAPVAESALNWLDVFVLGFGEETCKAEDVECLKRQKK